MHFYLTNGSLVGSYTVPTQTAQPVAVSGSNGSFNFSTLSLGSSNGMHFYTTNGSIVGSYTVPVQSNQSLGIFAIGNTTGQSSSSTFDARSLSLNGAGIISVGNSGGSVYVSATQSNQAASGSNGSFTFQTLSFGNLNGFSFYTSNGSIVGSYTDAGAGGGISAVVISVGTTNNAVSNFSFADSNGVSFGINGSVITASHNGLTTAAASDHSHGNPTLNLTNLSGTTASNSAGFTLSLSAAAAGGGGGATINNYVPFQLNNNNTSFSSMGQNTLYMQFMIPPENVTMNKFEIYARGSFVSSTNSQAYSQTILYGLYSQGTGASSTLMTQVGTSSIGMSVSYNSNTAYGYTLGQGATSFTSSSGGTALASHLSGPMHYYMPFASSMEVGKKYAFAFKISSTTAVGTSPMRFAPLVMTVMNSLSFAKLAADSITAPSTSNYGDWDMVAGTVTTAAMPASIAFNAMSIQVSRQRLFLQMEE